MITRKRMGYGGQPPMGSMGQMGQMGQSGPGRRRMEPSGPGQPNPAALQPMPLPQGGQNMSPDPMAAMNPQNVGAMMEPDMAGGNLMALLAQLGQPEQNPAAGAATSQMLGQLKRLPKKPNVMYDLPGMAGRA